MMCHDYVTVTVTVTCSQGKDCPKGRRDCVPPGGWGKSCMSCIEGWESMGDPTPWGTGEEEGENIHLTAVRQY